MRLPSLLPRAALAAVAAAAAVAGCGSDNNDNTTSTPAASAPAHTTPAPAASGSTSTSKAKSAAPAAAAPVAINADPNGNLKYVQSSLSAKAGRVTFKFTNQSSIGHGFTISGNGVNSAANIISQSSENLTVNLKPGTYTYFCPVPGHRQAGMQGTLTVR